jgi:hypothetical protein
MTTKISVDVMLNWFHHLKSIHGGTLKSETLNLIHGRVQGDRDIVRLIFIYKNCTLLFGHQNIPTK